MASIRQLGIFFGIAFMFGGLLGFFPGVIKNEMYLGIFRVNAVHNLLHLGSGALFLVASAIGPRIARLWFLAFGTVYGVMAAEGLRVGTGIICGCVSNNRNDAWGNAGMALSMFLIGILVRTRATPRK